MFKTCCNAFKAQKLITVCIKTSKSLIEPVYVVNEIASEIMQNFHIIKN